MPTTTREGNLVIGGRMQHTGEEILAWIVGGQPNVDIMRSRTKSTICTLLGYFRTYHSHPDSGVLSLNSDDGAIQWTIDFNYLRPRVTCSLNGRMVMDVEETQNLRLD